MDRRGTWSTIGGHVALDLANTVAWRLDPSRRIDRIATPAALAEWATALGLIAPDRARAGTDTAHDTTAAHRRVLEVRTAATRILDAGIDGARPDPAAVQELRRHWEAALAVATVTPTLPLRWTVQPASVHDVADLLALAAGDLLRREDPHLVRRCEGSGCGWLFIDSTRNHTRRWCDPQDCGNRARVRRYQARRRAG